MATANKSLRTLRSRAFRSGLVDGFTAMFKLPLNPRKYHYNHYDTVEASWREVGALLKEATQAQGVEVGKATKQKDTKSARH